MTTLAVLVLGANGMVGHAVMRALSSRPDWTVRGTQRTDADAPLYLNAENGTEQWEGVLRTTRYDYIINCIGILKSAIDENDAASVLRAITVNALFPNQLAEIAGKTNTRVIHVSTDGVFSGMSTRPYVESDPPDSLDSYGKTKALGECRSPYVLNLRCSLIGRDPVGKKGLIEWVLGSAEGAELPGFEDQMWNGISTAQFAALCRGILESGSFHRIRKTSCIHHFCPNEPISKYNLLCLVRQISGKNVEIRRAKSGMLGTSRILASCYQELSSLYPSDTSWSHVIHEALTDTP